MKLVTRASRQLFQILLFSILLTGADAVYAQTCTPAPGIGLPVSYIVGATLTDLNRNPVFNPVPNTDYLLKVCARVPLVCLKITSGGQLLNLTNCQDVGYASDHVPGDYSDIGEAFFRVRINTFGVQMTGAITPGVPCADAPLQLQTQYDLAFSVPSASTCSARRRYICGYAMPRYKCDNGRTSTLIETSDIKKAIDTCGATRRTGYEDFCHVIAKDGPDEVTFPGDSARCIIAGGSWRRGNNCCNFLGTKSCP